MRCSQEIQDRDRHVDFIVHDSMSFLSVDLAAGELVEVEMFWGYPRLKAVIDVPHLNREQVVNKLSKVCGCHFLCHCVSEGMCFGNVLNA